MSVDPTALVIPSALKPVDGRFGAGPSKVRPEQVAAPAEVGATYLGPSHRQLFGVEGRPATGIAIERCPGNRRIRCRIPRRSSGGTGAPRCARRSA